MFLLSLPSLVLVLFGTFILSPDSSHLEHVPVHIDGNGAPQFGDKGLVRVLIPSGGREEIHFVPATVGEFKYRCDLPGHQMVGKIVVEEHAADQRVVLRRSDSMQEKP